MFDTIVMLIFYTILLYLPLDYFLVYLAIIESSRVWSNNLMMYNKIKE